MEIYLKSYDKEGQKTLTRLVIDSNELNNKVESYPENVKESIKSMFSLESNKFCLLSENGIKLAENVSIKCGQIVQICPTVLGGKGGFGSLLRAFGKQITMSTNKEACRDLTGRRIRHVNNEKKLKDFLTKQAELVKQKETEQKEKSERRRRKRDKLEAKNHLFNDPKYDEQRQKITEDLDEVMGKVLAKKKKLNKKNEASNEAKTSKEAENKDDLDDGEIAEETENKPELENAVQSSSQQKIEEKPSQESETKPNDETKDKSNLTASNNQLQPKAKTCDSKKSKDSVFKDWMGVGDLDVSSSSDEDENEPAKKISKKS